MKDEHISWRLSKLPLSEKQKKKIRGLQSDFGVKTSEEEIDLVVYGASRDSELAFCGYLQSNISKIKYHYANKQFEDFS